MVPKRVVVWLVASLTLLRSLSSYLSVVVTADVVTVSAAAEPVNKNESSWALAHPRNMKMGYHAPAAVIFVAVVFYIFKVLNVPIPFFKP